MFFGLALLLLFSAIASSVVGYQRRGWRRIAAWVTAGISLVLVPLAVVVALAS